MLGGLKTLAPSGQCYEGTDPAPEYCEKELVLVVKPHNPKIITQHGHFCYVSTYLFCLFGQRFLLSSSVKYVIYYIPLKYVHGKAVF